MFSLAEMKYHTQGGAQTYQKAISVISLLSKADSRLQEL